MSRFWKAGERVKALIVDYNREISIPELQRLLGCRLEFIIHYKGDDVFLETPDNAHLNNCAPVSEGQFFEMLP